MIALVVLRVRKLGCARTGVCDVVNAIGGGASETYPTRG
jgi:hypothetical protein